MISLFNLKKSAIIVHAQPAYEGIYLGIDAELEQILKDALEKHDVIVNDKIKTKNTLDEKVMEMDKVLKSLENPEDTALRCIILMLR